MVGRERERARAVEISHKSRLLDYLTFQATCARLAKGAQATRSGRGCLQCTNALSAAVHIAQAAAAGEREQKELEFELYILYI